MQPYESLQIVRFNPLNQKIGEEAEEFFRCRGGGVLGRDGHIYAACFTGEMLKIDIVNNTPGLLLKMLCSSSKVRTSGKWWLHLFVIVFVSRHSCRTVWPSPKWVWSSFATVGDDLRSVSSKWSSGALAPDGRIYCITFNANQVLCIDPFKHFTTNLKDNMQQVLFASLAQKGLLAPLRKPLRSVSTTMDCLKERISIHSWLQLHWRIVCCPWCIIYWEGIHRLSAPSSVPDLEKNRKYKLKMVYN